MSICAQPVLGALSFWVRPLLCWQSTHPRGVPHISPTTTACTWNPSLQQHPLSWKEDWPSRILLLPPPIWLPGQLVFAQRTSCSLGDKKRTTCTKQKPEIRWSPRRDRDTRMINPKPQLRAVCINHWWVAESVFLSTSRLCCLYIIRRDAREQELRAQSLIITLEMQKEFSLSSARNGNTYIRRSKDRHQILTPS